MEIKTTEEIIKESNFNYLYPQASLRTIKESGNRKWVAVDDILNLNDNEWTLPMLRTELLIPKEETKKCIEIHICDCDCHKKIKRGFKLVACGCDCKRINNTSNYPKTETKPNTKEHPCPKCGATDGICVGALFG